MLTFNNYFNYNSQIAYYNIAYYKTHIHLVKASVQFVRLPSKEFENIDRY